MIFQKKVDSLLGAKASENQFVKQALKVSAETTSENGALKYSTSGNSFVDNFAAISYFKEPRSYEEVARDMSNLWSQDPSLCVKLAIYTRLVTRKSKIVVKDKVEVLDVQRGQGLKNEGIMRMLWLAINQPATFKVNLPLFIAAGSWKDVIQMLSLDLQYHGWDNKKLDWNFLHLVISAGLNNPETTHLVRKYLPTIRTNKNCKTLESQADTLIGRWLARKFNPELEKETAYKAYRKIKSEGTAHEWQQLISKQLYDQINFGTIAGRALSILVGSKFLENHGLVEKYNKWISSKPVAKFTGFVHELFTQLGTWGTHHIEDYKEKTINAQFAQLVKVGKEGVDTTSSLLVVRDTSSSMGAMARGCTTSSNCIAKSLALYFSEFLKGPFAGVFAEFANECRLVKWQGETPVDKYINDRNEAYGGTNFQSVIDLFIRLKEQGVAEEEFPCGILAVSDGEFNRCRSNKSTNFQTAIQRLKEAGFSKEYVDNFKIILWDIPNDYYGENSVKFEDFADAPNFFYMSGYDPSAVTFILGGSKPEVKAPKNAEELFMTAMDQELLNRVRIVRGKKK